MSQGRAKKKLQYFQGEGTAQSHLKIKEVFTLCDIDNLFDDIDADSELGLQLLSPLPKSTGVEQKKSESSSDPKQSSTDKMKAPFEKVPKDALIHTNGTQEEEMIEKESPFKEIAPIKTSSPIAMVTEGNDTVDGVRPVADPLLFGVEDEEPIGGGLSQPPCTDQSEPVMDSLPGDSGSLASPPDRFKIRKTIEPNAASLSCTKPAKSINPSVQATQSSPVELKENLQTEKDSSPLSPVLVEKNEQKSLEMEQSKDLMAEENGLSFQHKLKKALQPKPSCSRKLAAAPAPPPLDVDEDFMILEDEAPVLFSIPRKAEVSRNKRTVSADPAKEKVSAEPHSTDQLSQSETNSNSQQEMDANKVQSEPAKQKLKGKRGRASKKNDKDIVAHDGLEDKTDTVTETVEKGVSDHVSSHNLQEHKDVDSSATGKQRSKSKKAEHDELSDKDAKGAVSRTAKKSSKSSSSQPEKPESKGKKSSNKDVPASDHQTTNSVKSNKKGKNSRNGETISKTKKQTSKPQECETELDPASEHKDDLEPPPALNEQEEKQRAAVNKPSSTKQDALKNPTKKQKNKESIQKSTKQVESKPKDPTTFASDTSSDSPMTCRRKRRAPREWWLASQDDSTTEPQVELLKGTKTKNDTKTTTKQAAAVNCDKTQSLKPPRGNQKKSRTLATHSVVEQRETAGGDEGDTGAEQKTNKKKGVQRKRKSAATQPQVPSPTNLPEEEVRASLNESAEEISPALSSPHRQHSFTPGDIRVFDKVYTRDSGSAQKQPSSPLSRPEGSIHDNVPQKRQRKSPSNWWEVPQSQETTDELSPHNPPSEKSKAPNTHVSGVLNKGTNSQKSQKIQNHTKNVRRNIISTPKSIKRSLASMNAILTSQKIERMVKSNLRSRKQGRRNLLHSLEDQSEQSSENDQVQGNSHASFEIASGVIMEPTGTRNKKSGRISSGPNTLSDGEMAFKSGPSSMLDLQQHDEEDDDIGLPSSRVTSHPRHAPRVFAQCDLCGPPLQPIVLETEDWNNLHEWFSHLWPPASKDGRVISPDDFHWHSHEGRAMGHAVDLQNGSFSHGKILLGSFMKKPSQVDPNTVSVFSIISSCVRVDIDGLKSVYNSGQVFMIPSGQVYSIHNLCQEPAVLIYHRTQSDFTQR